MIVAGPFIAVGGARCCARVMSRLGLEGRLAVDNTARNPQRTATTANALLIGVFLVTLVTVAGTSGEGLRRRRDQQARDSADYLVVSNGGTIDPAFVGKLEAVDGVDKVVAVPQRVGHDRRRGLAALHRRLARDRGDRRHRREGRLHSTTSWPGTIALVETTDDCPRSARP